jgi:hypothetical protein
VLLSVLALVVAAQAAPVFTVAVRYAAEDRGSWARDLAAIRALGFTAVVVPDDRVEPIRSMATEAELQVIAKRDEDRPPTIVLDGSGPPFALRYRGWTAIRYGARAIVFALDATRQAPTPVEGRATTSLEPLPSVRAAGAFASTVAGSASLFLTMKPIDGAQSAVVDARLFRSGQALVLIALNHHDAPREGIITLPPSMPLAEWVNLETGEVASFDREPDGVAHRHQFAARDALVLVIRRDIQ